MSRKLIALFLCLALMVSAAALADDDVIRVTDMFGREIVLTEPATRVVALTPADCEILCALGCEEALVGRGQYCDYPASILDVPVVLSGIAPSNIASSVPEIISFSYTVESFAIPPKPKKSPMLSSRPG